jgi:glutamate-1-semialdehyde 2,1-aminomutase
MFTAFFSAIRPTDWSTAKTADTARFGRFFQKMLENGVYLAPSQFEAGFVSTAHSADVIDATIAAAEQAFAAC